MRVRASLLLALFVLSLFVGRLIQIQGLDATALASQALGTRTNTDVLPAHRGDILDADGVVLATTVERRDITVDQRLVPLYERPGDPDGQPSGVRGAAEDLAPLLGVDVDTLVEQLTGDEPFAYVHKGVAPEVWREVAELNIPAMYGEYASERVYPAGAVGASTLGFLGNDGVPLAGLEMTRNDLLSGTDGSLSYEHGRDGRVIPIGQTARVDPVDGQDLHLTLDRDLQYKAQQLLTDQVAASDAEWGSVVAMRPTGEILALANAPTLDSNNPSAAAAQDRGNRALIDMFEPGSTSKVITAAAALEEGVVTPETQFEVPYTIQRGRQRFKDSSAHALERLTFAGVLAKSSNTGTIMVGEKLDRETLHGYMSRFGLGEPSGLNFPGETSGILADPSDWDGRQQYTVMFGQGVATNALQAASVYATIANGGLRAEPSVVAGNTGPDGVFHPAAEQEGTRVVSEETADTMALLLEGAVNEGGTGGNAAVPGYRVAGKTGTAEAVDPDCGCYRGYTGSFIGFAPADDPEIIIAVTVQRPQNGYYGGTVAAPVFQELMTYALQHLEIPPTGTTPTAPPLTWE